MQYGLHGSFAHAAASADGVLSERRCIIPFSCTLSCARMCEAGTSDAGMLVIELPDPPHGPQKP